ncbi:MAG TPA: hypothetical protein PKI83_03130, partial [Bacteroidales bacterium]|nr:hypothetical protein [Bacteroidales bacterium]
SNPASNEYWDARLKELPTYNVMATGGWSIELNNSNMEVDETLMPWYRVSYNPNNEPGETEMTLEEMDTILQAQQAAIDQANYNAVVARLPTSYNLMNIEQTNQMKTAYETYFLNDEKTKNLTIALLIGGLLTTGVILLVRK